MDEEEYDPDINSDDLDSFEPVARIVVIGVGGAGNNAVNRMIDDNIRNVEFYVMNTDKQALASSKAPNRVILGKESTRGLGAGGEPAVGKLAAEQSTDTIKRIVEGADMVFIAAGMGKGTGTGAAPVVAKIAKDAGALTIAIVTRPFTFEGKKRTENAIQGLTNLKNVVDSIIIVSNDKLLTSAGGVPIDKAFQESDHILAQSVKTVADLILVPGQMNLDFADVKSTLKDSGVALIGFGMGKGPNKAEEAALNAINSPLLETKIQGAKRAICSITCGQQVTMYEAQKCVMKIIDEAGGATDVKLGISNNPNLEDALVVSVIAADFDGDKDFISAPEDTPMIQPTPSLNDQTSSDPGASSENDFGPDIDLSDSLMPHFSDD